MKRLKVAVVTGLIAMVMSTSVYAGTGNINVAVNGTVVEFTDAKPYVDANGRTMIPVAKMGELLGVQVGWYDATQTVTLKKGSSEVSLRLNDDTININGVTSKMDTKAVSKNGRTYVPVSAIAEAFGTEVTWNKATSTVELSTSMNSKFSWLTGTGEYTTEDYAVINQEAYNHYALDGNDFYFVDTETKEFKRLNVVTKEETILLSNCGYAKEIYVTEDYIFLKLARGYSRMSKDGSEIVKLPFSAEKIQVYKDKLYYFTHPDLKLYVTDFEFTNIEEVKEGFWCSSFVIYNDKLTTLRGTVTTLDLNTLEVEGMEYRDIQDSNHARTLDIATGNYVLTNKLSKTFDKVNIEDKTSSTFNVDYMRRESRTSQITLDNKLYYIASEGIIEHDMESGVSKLLVEGDDFLNMTYIEGHLLVSPANKSELTVVNLATGEIVVK